MDLEVEKMKKISKKSLIISVLACLLPIVISIMVYNKLPENIPSHFGANCEPDRYASKNFILFVIPAIMTIVQMICAICMVCADKKYKQIPRIFKVLQWLVPAITIVIYAITVLYALGIELHIGKIILFVLGILFCLLGNYFPKMSYESSKQFVHPKPKNEQSFRKMVNTAGYLFLGMGAVLLVLMFIV
jgi:uncharacterized membrane protein